jgi:hypothetical protein
MFQLDVPTRSPMLIVFRRVVVLVLTAFVLIGMVSTYRAWYQIKSLELSADSVMRAGSVIQTKVITYGRTPVDVQVELIQGSHSETIATYAVRANNWAFFNPRTRHASQNAFLTQGVLVDFEPGPAFLRATATGRHQWTRLPPPLIRTTNVEIQR